MSSEFVKPNRLERLFLNQMRHNNFMVAIGSRDLNNNATNNNMAATVKHMPESAAGYAEKQKSALPDGGLSGLRTSH